MDQDVLNESLSLTDALHDQPPTLTHMLWKIKDFAELILGDKFQNLDELWKVAIQKAIIPGTESSDLMKLGTKPEVCDSLELACSAIFCTFLPGLKRLYLDSKVTSDVNKVTVKQSSPEPSVELLEMQKEVIRLQKEVIQLKDELHNAEKSAFSTTVKKELRSYSTVLSQNCAAAVALKRLQTALKKANAPVVSDSEDDRSKNLMIFGLPESEDEEDAATKEEALKVFTHLEVTPTVTSSTRVGSKTSGRPRPVKVSLEKKEDILALLKKARLLRQAASYRTVYLSPDLTKEEREDSTRLYKTVKQLRLDNPGRKYWVRGGSIMFDV